jgi:hypothetical protein
MSKALDLIVEAKSSTFKHTTRAEEKIEIYYLFSHPTAGGLYSLRRPRLCVKSYFICREKNIFEQRGCKRGRKEERDEQLFAKQICKIDFPPPPRSSESQIPGLYSLPRRRLSRQTCNLPFGEQKITRACVCGKFYRATRASTS